MNKLSWLQQNKALFNRPLRKEISGRLIGKRPLRTKHRVIIQFKRKLTEDQIRALRKHLGRHPLSIKRRLRLLNAVSAHVSTDCLKRMCGCGDVNKIYMDSVKKQCLNIATPSIGSSAVQRKSKLTGKDIRIGIIDTGVYPHPDLTRPVNRIIAFKDLVNGRKRPYDDNGHGTHLAGDSAGNGHMSKGKYIGPAPEAEIVAVKALNRDGEGYDSDIIKAIEWCVANRKRFKLRLLILSFGGPVYSDCSEDPLCQAVEKAVKAGIVVVAAAGNGGPKRSTIEAPGNSPSAITVGAVNDRRKTSQAGDRVAYFSSRGPAPGARQKPDLVAPGESIVSLRAPRSTLDRKEPYNRVGKGYFTMTGTSVSAPIVAGVAAQLLQRNPRLTPAQVKALLKRHAYRLRAGRNAQGSGVVNARFMLGRGC